MDDPIKGQLTSELRFKELAVMRNGQPTRVRVLQQRWIKPDGADEWRDVPMVRLPREPKPAT